VCLLLVQLLRPFAVLLLLVACFAAPGLAIELDISSRQEKLRWPLLPLSASGEIPSLTDATLQLLLMILHLGSLP
jgi:hypothetical protein